MAEEDVHRLFESTWIGIVEACLKPLTSTQVQRGLKLIQIVPQNETTSFQHRLRSAVYTQFHQHAIGKEWIVNVSGAKVSLQLKYDGDLDNIIDEDSRRNIREQFERFIHRARAAYEQNGEVEKQREAADLVDAFINL